MKIEKLEKNQIKVTAKVTLADFESGLDYAYQLVKEKVELKGFRKGQAPRSIYENRYGKASLFNDALNFVINAKFEDVLMEKTYEVVAEPTNVELNPKEPKLAEEEFEVILTIPVKPEVKLGKYKGIEIKKPDTKVSPKEVEQKINEELNRSSKLLAADKAVESGDTANINFEGFIDGTAFAGGKGTDFDLKIGSGQFIPGFEEQLIGLKAGEEKDVNVTFPEDYQVQDLKGKAAVFKCKVNAVKVTHLPELTDEWVKDLKKDKIETVEQYKAHVKSLISQLKEKQENERIKKTALEEASANAVIEIHDAMIMAQVNRNRRRIEESLKAYGMNYQQYLEMTGKKSEDAMAEEKKAAYEQIHEALTLDAIADAEKLEITDAEIEEHFKEIAKQYNVSVEEVKKQLSKENIEKDLKVGKAHDLIVKNAKLV
mgnify:CR=1 FL=1